jgi:phage repressor protein C with HTH and peptisase S24 domain
MFLYPFCAFQLTSVTFTRHIFGKMRQSDEPLDQIRELLGLTQIEFARKLGISRPYLSKIENARVPLSPKVRRRLEEIRQGTGSPTWKSPDRIRYIAVRSWAQAGAGVDFEELPLDWQNQVPTDCPDEKAFAVEIKGDSMEPKYSPGDVAVLMPSYPPRNGSLVVARLDREDIVFKVFTARGQSPGRTCSFTSYNQVYQPIEVPESGVVWNYPVYLVIHQVWR